jgi:hypothetical protein
MLAQGKIYCSRNELQAAQSNRFLLPAGCTAMLAMSVLT